MKEFESNDDYFLADPSGGGKWVLNANIAKEEECEPVKLVD